MNFVNATSASVNLKKGSRWYSDYLWILFSSNSFWILILSQKFCILSNTVNWRIQLTVGLFFLIFIAYLLMLFLHLQRDKFFEFLLTTQYPWVKKQEQVHGSFGSFMASRWVKGELFSSTSAELLVLLI